MFTPVSIIKKDAKRVQKEAFFVYLILSNRSRVSKQLKILVSRVKLALHYIHDNYIRLTGKGMAMKRLLLVCALVGELIGSTILAHSKRQHGYIYVTPPHRFVFDSIYHQLKDDLDLFKADLHALPGEVLDYFVSSPDSDKQTAQVRVNTTNEPGAEEQSFLTKRLPRVKSALERFFNSSLEKCAVPRIALCFSGGGFRAMALTLGFLCGMQNLGLLDATTYISALSGSTWAVGPWISSGKDINEYKQNVTSGYSQGLEHITDRARIKELALRILEKLYYAQAVSPIDIYGALLANTLLKDLGDKRLVATLSETHARVSDGSYPLPIYTAINTSMQPYDWLEFTPFEIGSSYLRSFVPTWSYGRKFVSGVSVDTDPEQVLGFFMGVFGSAFELSLSELVRDTAGDIGALRAYLPDLLCNYIERALHLIAQSPLGDIRPWPAVMRNFMYGMASSPLKSDETMAPADAGIDFNLPLPPVLYPARQADIIIIYDASLDIAGAPELKAAEEYARRNGLAFPAIDYSGIDSRKVSVFSDTNNPACPTVVYFPRIKNNNYDPTFDPDLCVKESYCDTFNFNYSPEQFTQLSGLSEYTVKESASVIADAIKSVIQLKGNASCVSP
jgi:cytosolic phospholipase A2